MNRMRLFCWDCVLLFLRNVWGDTRGTASYTRVPVCLVMISFLIINKREIDFCDMCLGILRYSFYAFFSVRNHPRELCFNSYLRNSPYSLDQFLGHLRTELGAFALWFCKGACIRYAVTNKLAKLILSCPIFEFICQRRSIDLVFFPIVLLLFFISIVTFPRRFMSSTSVVFIFFLLQPKTFAVHV